MNEPAQPPPWPYGSRSAQPTGRTPADASDPSVVDLPWDIADPVETHVEGLSPRSHVAQVPHDLIERVDVDGGRRQQGDVGRNDLGQRISSGLPHRPHLGGVVGGQGDGHTDHALVRVWCGDLHGS